MCHMRIPRIVSCVFVCIVLSGCASGVPVQQPESPDLVTEAACALPDQGTLQAIDSMLHGVSGPYNPTVVSVGSTWEVVAYGSGASSMSVYIARVGDSDTSSWVSLSALSANPLGMTADEMDRISVAADRAQSCARGG